MSRARRRGATSFRSSTPGDELPRTTCSTHHYFQSFNASSENLQWALEMEADRMVNSFIRKSDLDSEMTVVRNELENWENNPQGVLFGRMLATAYQWHNYGKSTIGARTDIENVDVARLQAFYRMYYQPDNAVVVIAGKFDPDATLALVAKYFGPIRSLSDAAERIRRPVQDGERRVRFAVRKIAYVGSCITCRAAPTPTTRRRRARDVMTLGRPAVVKGARRDQEGVVGPVVDVHTRIPVCHAVGAGAGRRAGRGARPCSPRARHRQGTGHQDSGSIVRERRRTSTRRSTIREVRRAISESKRSGLAPGS